MISFERFRILASLIHWASTKKEIEYIDWAQEVSMFTMGKKINAIVNNHGQRINPGYHY